MVARERASEGCLAAWRGRSLPRTLMYVSQLHARSRPYHRAWAEPTEYLIIALPEEKPRRHQDRQHAHGDPDCPCTFRDARRTCRAQCPSTKVTLCNRATPGPASAITCGAPPVTTRHGQLYTARFLLLLPLL